MSEQGDGGPAFMNNTNELTIELVSHGAQMTQLELRLPDDLSLEDWAAIGHKLCRADQVMKWWLGDWAAYGRKKFGNLKDFARANNITYNALRDAADVSDRIEATRRRDNLEWRKHFEVIDLEPKDQTKWLSKAESEGLTTSEMRKQMRLSLGTQNALKPDGPIIKLATKSAAELLHFLKKQPAAFWCPDRKSLWRTILKPIVEFYERLA